MILNILATQCKSKKKQIVLKVRMNLQPISTHLFILNNTFLLSASCKHYFCKKNAMELLFDLDDIEIVAKQFILDIDDCKIIAFDGDLGAGKTTFITAVCKELQVKETITSPTYSIIQEYHFGKENIIYHMDLYRIKNIEEALDAGVEECLQSAHLCFVEWPENARSFFIENTVWVTLKTVSEFGRKMVVQLP